MNLLINKNIKMCLKIPNSNIMLKYYNLKVNNYYTVYFKNKNSIFQRYNQDLEWILSLVLG